ENDQSHPDYQGDQSLPDRIGAERGADGALFEIDDLRRQRARFQHQAEVFRLLLGKAALDAPAVVNSGSDDGHALDLVVENDRQVIAYVGSGPGAELLGTARLEIECDLVAEALLGLNAARVAQVGAGDHWRLFDDVKTGVRASVAALLVIRQHFLI